LGQKVTSIRPDLVPEKCNVGAAFASEGRFAYHRSLVVDDR